MTKLCPRGKAAAKRKFKVYPSAYANAYASKICAGKIKDPSGVKRKEFKRGTGLRRPSNVEKIKKAFGPKQKPQTRMTGKKKKFPDLTGDGKVTFADILKGRGVINGKKKKKVI